LSTYTFQLHAIVHDLRITQRISSTRNFAARAGMSPRKCASGGAAGSSIANTSGPNVATCTGRSRKSEARKPEDSSISGARSNSPFNE